MPIYITFAYKLALAREQLQAMLAGLPKWLGTDVFEIKAKAEGNPTKDQMRLMLRSLPADRFRLKIHFESREMPVYALVLASRASSGQKCIPTSRDPLATARPLPTIFRVIATYWACCRGSMVRAWEAHVISL